MKDMLPYYNILTTLPPADGPVAALMPVIFLAYLAGLILLLCAPVRAVDGGISGPGKKAIFLLAPLMVFLPGEVAVSWLSFIQTVVVTFLTPVMFAVIGWMPTNGKSTLKNINSRVLKVIFGATALTAIVMVFHTDYVRSERNALMREAGDKFYREMLSNPVEFDLAKLSEARRIDATPHGGTFWRTVAEASTLGVGKTIWNLKNPEREAVKVAPPSGNWSVTFVDIETGKGAVYRFACQYSDNDLFSVAAFPFMSPNYLENEAMSPVTDFCPKTRDPEIAASSR